MALIRNTKNIFDKIIERLKLFFKEVTLKDSLTFSFFLVLAVILWGMQVYTQKLEIRLSIPIKYTNASDNILYEYPLPGAIDVYVKDYGSAALKYAAKHKDSIEIDLSVFTKNRDSKLTLQGQELEQMVRTLLLPSSELTSFSPTFIAFDYNIVAIKKVPVIFDGLANLSVGYQLDGDISIQPDSVLAYGPESILDTLSYAYTDRDTIQVNKSQQVAVKIRSISNVNFQPNSITLDIPVDEFIERKVKVPVECINLPNDLNIKFFPPEVTVNFFIGSKRNNLIDYKNFKIIVDYNQIESSEASSIPIRIFESPEFVRIKELEPSEVEFILEQQ